MSLPGTRKVLIASAIVAAVVGAGCSAGGQSPAPVQQRAQAGADSGSDYGAGYGSGYGDSGAASGAAGATTDSLRVSSVANLSDVVTDAAGFTLYRFDKDSNKPSTSNCAGQCLDAWPPALVGSADLSGVTVEGIDRAKLGVLPRPDGTKQLTLNQWPLYRFAKDTAPGQVNGEGAQGTWWAIASTGVKAKDKAPAEAAGTTLIKAMDVVPFGKVLTDKDGMTLYRFDKDKPNPPVSNCNGDCAAQWPPVLADGNVVAEGVDQNLVGTVVRADGTRQVTVGGWALYRFAKDTAACQTNGEGVGGTWFVAAPDGKKAKDKIAR